MNPPPPPGRGGDLPERRREEDMPHESMQLILYQLSELKAAVREGFVKMEGRFDAAETRIAALERFRERQEQRDRLTAETSQSMNSRWIPILLTAITVCAGLYVGLKGG